MPGTAQARISISALNALSEADFTAALSGLLEHSPHFVARAARARPFADADALLAALLAEVAKAGEAEQVALLRAHPDLGERAARLTAESTREQAAAGMVALSPEALAELRRLNTEYRTRFEFPFIICARLNSPETIFTALRTRLHHDRTGELQAALIEVGKIAKLRLNDLIAP